MNVFKGMARAGLTSLMLVLAAQAWADPVTDDETIYEDIARIRSTQLLEQDVMDELDRFNPPAAAAGRDRLEAIELSMITYRDGRQVSSGHVKVRTFKDYPGYYLQEDTLITSTSEVVLKELHKGPVILLSQLRSVHDSGSAIVQDRHSRNNSRLSELEMSGATDAAFSPNANWTYHAGTDWNLTAKKTWSFKTSKRTDYTMEDFRCHNGERTPAANYWAGFEGTAISVDCGKKERETVDHYIYLEQYGLFLLMSVESLSYDGKGARIRFARKVESVHIGAASNVEK